jgi:hypothetical protein
MKTFWMSGAIAPRILDPCTRWKWVVSFTPRPLFPQGKSPWYPLDRRLGGPQSRSGRGGEEKNSQPPLAIEPQNPDRPARSQALYRLSYHGSDRGDCSAWNADLFSSGVKRHRYFLDRNLVGLQNLPGHSKTEKNLYACIGNRSRYQVNYFICKDPKLYWGGTRFESRPRYRRSELMFLMILLGLFRPILGQYVETENGD